MVLEQLRKKTLKTVHINTCVSYRLFVLDKIRPENCFDSEQFGMISSVFRFNEWHLDQQRKLGKEEKYLFFCPGSAAGAAALKSGQGPPGRGIAVRQFSPLRRREGPRPLPQESRYRQKLPRFTVFCARRIFSPFSELVAQDGSTWANIGVKKGQHSPQDGPTWPQDGPT